jgi:Succinate dehydrogenase/fumarate reductase, flavoprotein subunit
MQVHKYDVVIVGAGGAGMRAAIESGQRAHTAVLTKLYPTRSHTGAAQGGMCAALANVEEDNWEWHTFDTVKGGDYLVDQDAAEIMAKEAIDAVLDLEKWVCHSTAPQRARLTSVASAVTPVTTARQRYAVLATQLTAPAT